MTDIRHGGLPEYRLAEVTRWLVADAKAPAKARALVRECFEGRLSAERIEDLEVLVSELVTNSVRHGKLPPDARIKIRSYLHDGRVRIEVQDPGKKTAFLRTLSSEPRESGYGLQLVEELSTRWGVHLNGHTEFWFELDL